MAAWLTWYLAITVVGLAAFPLAYRLLPGLPDRGYSLARALGWLVWGYAYWLLGSLHALPNNTGGLLLALSILIALSAWAAHGRGSNVLAFVRAERGRILAAELVFALAFAAWAFGRAAAPDITNTEKPMELAFLNAVLRSPTFPPFDPWLSGYAISYYYFGYVLVGMLTMLTGVQAAVGFNLGISLVFGLGAVGAYGLVSNLLRAHSTAQPAEQSAAPRGWGALPLLGPLFLLLVSNFEGFLEVLHARGLFWAPGPDGALQSRFWSWLGILELNQPPIEPFRWLPERPGSLLYWRASRVVSDYTAAGDYREIINEFPFFSFLLSDLHPHVLALPFALLSVGLALALFLRPGEEETRLPFGLRLPVSPGFFALSSLVLGGLAFLNTWDFPIHLSLLCAAFVLRQALREGWTGRRLAEFLALALTLGVAALALYLPFLVGFSSQAGGVLPSLVFFTRGAHFWVHFGPLLIPLFVLLGVLAFRRYRRGFALGRGLALAAGVMAGLWAASYALAWLITQVSLPGMDLAGIFLSNLGVYTGRVSDALAAATTARLAAPGAWLTLLALLTLVFGLLAGRERVPGAAPGPAPTVPAAGFLVLLALWGGLLTLGPEFVYLRDQFGSRINTIFKFYYQAWILWALAAAAGAALLLRWLRGAGGLAWRAGLLLTLAMGLAYAPVMLDYRTNGFQPFTGFTLDGTAYLERTDPDLLAAYQWLRQAEPGVIAEAIGGQYSQFARFATHTGQPTILGWPGHESQWRGTSEGQAERIEDVETLYRTPNWAQAQAVLDRYAVRYIIVSDLERSAYRVNEAKFQNNVRLAFQRGSLAIYEYVPVLAYQNGGQP